MLCNNSTFHQETGKSFGDPTEICLKRFVGTFDNIKYVQTLHPRTHEVPFSSETKYMITVNKFDKKERAHLKGAPEVVLKKCSRIFQEGKVIRIDESHKKDILRQNDKYSRQGFRVLGCALKDIAPSRRKNESEGSDYCFYGLVIMQDPPRAEVPEAVSLCHQAGIRIIVISGDQSTTVESIARQVGIVSGNSPIVINGSDLGKYDDERLKDLLKKEEVIFARSMPQDKLRIVSLLKDMGEIVAVTGDGVNDAPAIRKADVGISMGKSGTEVAKEASDIILLDDNFASIVEAIKSGRTVYDNIKSFITYILTSNTPEIIPFLVFILFGWPLALPVLLILAIDLGTDMLPAIGLGVEPSSKEIMKRKPRDPNSKLLNWKMIARSYGFIGPLQTFFAYVIFFRILFAGGWSFGAEISLTSPLYFSVVTGFFATVVITQIFNVFACRTTRASVFSKKLFSNKFIIFGILTEIVLLTLIATAPPFQRVFGTYFFPWQYVPWMVGFGAIILLCEELRKLIFRRYGVLGMN